MPEVLPSQDVVSAIEAGITRVTRRVEFYEADGLTRFYPNGSDEDVYRLIGGSIGVDSGRGERRSLDIDLDNRDGFLRPNSNGGFWYDKIIKPYRGVRYASKDYSPRILIIEAPTLNDAYLHRATLYRLGYNKVDINLNATTLSHLTGYAIIYADGGTNAITKHALLKSAYTNGFDIFTRGLKNGTAQIPFVTSQFTFTATSTVSITPVAQDTPLDEGWTAQNQGSVVNGSIGITGLQAGATIVATSLNQSTTHYTAIIEETTNARWFNYKPTVNDTQALILFKNAINWLWNFKPQVEWETPLGTYLIDTIRNQSFPNEISASCRDLTKRCMNSKIRDPLSFDAGTRATDLIKSLAANAMITNIDIPTSGVTIGKQIDLNRGTDRWDIMKQAADLIKHDVYFNRHGFLTISPWADPTLGSPVATFKTGPEGNLASFDRSTNDTRIYNHIVVTGKPESEDESLLEYRGEAINDNPSSPTNRARLGDRTYFYESSFFTSNAQCQDYANKLLGQSAFEQYDLNMSSFVYPWLEAGVVVDFQDPDNIAGDPTRFLLSTLTIPLDLSPMGSTGKRVVFVEDSSGEQL